MLPEGFLSRLADTAGRDVADRFSTAVAQEGPVSIHLNPFKQPSEPDPLLEGASPVPWNGFGRFLASRPVFTLQPLFHAGAYYVQDSSAMYAGWVFRQLLDGMDLPADRGIRVLDLCAAPGGKTTDLTASLRLRLGDRFLLVANDVMRPRAAVLSDNVAVWGDPNVVVTGVDPRAFASFEGFFDMILVDAPCSGEGMFRKDEKAVQDWSPQTVELCASRQRRILADVWPALRKDGVLIYSTCTFDRQENDGNVAWACETLDAAPLTPGNAFEGILETGYGHLLVPGMVPGEGQFVAAARKLSGPGPSRKDPAALQALRPLRHGVRKGEWKGKDFVPDPDWPLSLAFERGSWPEWGADRETALGYLHRDALRLQDAPMGYVVLTYGSLPLGFVKNLGSRCNNLLPPSRRIRMDINRCL